LLPCSLALLAAGCAATPQPLDTTPVELRVDHRARLSTPVDNDARPPKDVTVAIFAVRQPPDAQPIEPQLALIAAERGAPFRSASDLPAGTLWSAASSAGLALSGAGEGSEQAGVQQVGSGRVVVASGLCTRIEFSTPRLPALELRQRDAHIEMQLDLQPMQVPDQRLLLGEPLPESAPGLLFVPLPGGHGTGYAVVITIEGNADAEAATAAAEAAHAAPQRTAASLHGAQWQLATTAIGEWNRRTALLAVAQNLGCRAISELLLASDLSRLTAIAASVQGVDPEGPSYAWSFERAVWSALLPSVQRDDLTPALYACLLRELGAVATNPGGLRLCLERAQSAEEFEAGLREENRLALEDRDPVPRVRAHEWLTNRGEAVTGYDPLAGRDTRNAALRRYEAARAKAGAGEGGR
jgi:hypothetical protein